MKFLWCPKCRVKWFPMFKGKTICCGGGRVPLKDDFRDTPSHAPIVMRPYKKREKENDS